MNKYDIIGETLMSLGIVIFLVLFLLEVYLSFVEIQTELDLCQSGEEGSIISSPTPSH